MDDLEKIICCICGVIFHINKDVCKAWGKVNKTFCCPNGHALAFDKSSVDSIKICY